MTISDLSSLFTGLAVLVAVIALIFESRRDRLSLQVNMLLQLNEKLNSSELKSIRQIAARKLLSDERPNYELEEVLELLSTIAFLYERSVIDNDLTYREFSYWLTRYWLSAKKYVKEQSRKYDPLGYTTLERVAGVFIKKELKDGYPPFSEEVLRSFLQGETRDPSKVV